MSSNSFGILPKEIFVNYQDIYNDKTPKQQQKLKTQIKRLSVATNLDKNQEVKLTNYRFLLDPGYDYNSLIKDIITKDKFKNYTPTKRTKQKREDAIKKKASYKKRMVEKEVKRKEEQIRLKEEKIRLKEELIRKKVEEARQIREEEARQIRKEERRRMEEERRRREEETKFIERYNPRLKLMNAYKSMGLDVSLHTRDDARKIHRINVRKYHPDKNKDPKAKPIFLKIQEAWDIIDDHNRDMLNK
jgi:hypothetical protein